MGQRRVQIHSANMADGCSLPGYIIAKSISGWRDCPRCYRHRVSYRSSGAPFPGPNFLRPDHSMSNWAQPIDHAYSTRLTTGKQVFTCSRVPFRGLSEAQDPGGRGCFPSGWALSQLSTSTHYIPLICRAGIHSGTNGASTHHPHPEDLPI